MIEMPAPQFVQTNAIRMGYYEAGPKSDAPRHSLPWLAGACVLVASRDQGVERGRHSVIAPDQRGYGVTDRPDAVEAYDIEHLTGDLVGLLDQLKIEKAIFVGHDWGGFVVWQMPLRHPGRVAGVVGVNTPHTARPPADPIELFRKNFGEQMYIVNFKIPGMRWTGYSTARSSRHLTHS